MGPVDAGVTAGALAVALAVVELAKVYISKYAKAKKGGDTDEQRDTKVVLLLNSINESLKKTVDLLDDVKDIAKDGARDHKSLAGAMTRIENKLDRRETTNPGGPL